MLIEEWQKRPLPEIKLREIEIGDWFNSDQINKIISVTGFRRSGKTFLLLDFVKKHRREDCLYLNLEDERLPKETAVLTELSNIVKEYYGTKKIFLLLDEIQEIPQWSRWCRRVNEAGLYYLIISGSSSKLSSAEIPTELRGRTITKTVYPLSYHEFKIWKNEEGYSALREYLLYGGFPEIVLADFGKKEILLNEYMQTFLLRDIFERYNLRQKEAMNDLIRLLLSSPYYTIGRLTKSLRVADYKIGKGTVAKYLTYLSSSFFLRTLEIHTAKVKSRIQHPKKSYFCDSFFLSRAGNFSANLGRLMEEAVLSLYWRQKTKEPNTEVYYWKNQKGEEVDYVVRKNLTVEELIQVSYVSSLSDINERELTALLKAGTELKCDNLILITWDYEGETKAAGRVIKLIPLEKFLQRSL
ncbi:MAG: ATP-binding protein [bacterium]|nr:ATP-binding protein [bacterium]